MEKKEFKELKFSNVEEKLCDWFDLVVPPVLWLLSGSALPGHLPLQDGTSNRAKSFQEN